MKCPHCNKEFQSSVDVEKALLARNSWSSWAYSTLNSSTIISSLGSVKVVDVQTDTELDIYGEGVQGSSTPTHLVFEIAGKFYKKEGSADSYGEVSWAGSFDEVAPKTKIITVYEWK